MPYNFTFKNTGRQQMSREDSTQFLLHGMGDDPGEGTTFTCQVTHSYAIEFDLRRELSPVTTIRFHLKYILSG